jgi:hypothetical protein
MWWKQKTLWTALAGMLTACGAYFAQEISLAELITALFAGFSIIFLRQGVAKVAPVFLIAAVVASCSITYHDKRTVFQTGSITNNASGSEEAVPIYDESGKVIGFAAGTRTSEGETGAGTGGTTTDPTAGGGRGPGQGDTKTGAMNSSGFIIVSIGQNDGVEQRTDPTVDTTLDATLNKTPTPTTGTP